MHVFMGNSYAKKCSTLMKCSMVHTYTNKIHCLTNISLDKLAIKLYLLNITATGTGALVTFIPEKLFTFEKFKMYQCVLYYILHSNLNLLLFFIALELVLTYSDCMYNRTKLCRFLCHLHGHWYV